MVFGDDKIPDIARGMGKGMRQLKDASDDIKREIYKSADKHGVDTSSVAKDVKKEIDEVKDGLDDLTGSIRRKF